MNRRSIITATGTSIACIIGKIWPSKTPPKKEAKILIPENVAKEMAEIISRGGKITGYSYSYPPTGTSASFGQCHLVNDEDRNWKLA